MNSLSLSLLLFLPNLIILLETNQLHIIFTEVCTALYTFEAEEEDELNMRDAQMRTIFDMKDGVLDMRKRRATDVKCNSRVILPRKIRDAQA